MIALLSLSCLLKFSLHCRIASSQFLDSKIKLPCLTDGMPFIPTEMHKNKAAYRDVTASVVGKEVS